MSSQRDGNERGETARKGRDTGGKNKKKGGDEVKLRQCGRDPLIPNRFDRLGKEKGQDKRKMEKGVARLWGDGRGTGLPLDGLSKGGREGKRAGTGKPESVPVGCEC